MDKQALRDLIAAPLLFFEETPSTNKEALRWAKEGAPPGALILADQQTMGRGRMGRSFFSPEGGLYMSLIVDAAPHLAGGLTTLAAVAVCEAVQAVCGKALAIKWVNDCLLDGRKVCGILAEGLIQMLPPRAVIGIGVNVLPCDFPTELKTKAGSLYAKGETPPALVRERLAAAIRKEILDGLPHLPRHMDAYRAKCLTLGREVEAVFEGRPICGLASAVRDDGALMVETADGTIALTAGEATVRPISQHDLYR